jgi:hypothetical protein
MYSKLGYCGQLRYGKQGLVRAVQNMNQLRQITVRIQMRFQLFAHQHMRINALMNAAEYE